MTRVWQPIASAPRDGTEFLAYDHAVAKMAVCHWGRNGPRPTQFDRLDGPMSDEFGYRKEGIRHWMPLPAAPGPA